MFFLLATKKVGGNSKNGRTSLPKYRGIKRNHDQFIRSGSVIVSQKGNKFFSGINTFQAKNFSIHAKIDGRVIFFNFKNKKYIRVEPLI